MAIYEDSEPAAAGHQDLAEQLRRFETFDELRRSDFYRALRGTFSRLFDEPRIYMGPDATPRLGAFLRVATWNIERGTRFEGIVEVLNHHPVLGRADLLLLNELDDGMVRSGNRSVAFELGQAVGAHAIYGVEYLELTKGSGDESRLPGCNTAALHGNAILTRHEFTAPEIVHLPRCENNFESAEKRLGGRIAILAEIEIGGIPLTVATAHLDVVNTPRCRGRQMRAVLEAVDKRAADGRADNRAIFGGDLNTHTFARGSRWRGIKNTAVILGSRPDRLAARLANPAQHEPALRELVRFGFDLRDCNDRRSTARSVVSNLDDSRHLPAPLRWWIRRRLGGASLTLELRLDWLAARGVRPLRRGEVVDPKTGVSSVDPQAFAGLEHKGRPLSDHDPIVLDLLIE